MSARDKISSFSNTAKRKKEKNCWTPNINTILLKHTRVWKKQQTTSWSSIRLWRGGAFKLNQGIISHLFFALYRACHLITCGSGVHIRHGGKDGHECRRSNRNASPSSRWFPLNQENSWVCWAFPNTRYHINHRYKEASVCQIKPATKF